MSDNIASIYIDAKLNTKILQQQILDIEKTKFNLNIQVNDSRLTDLNKHFALKRKDFDDLQRHFATNALSIRVDDSSLTELNKQFADIKKQIQGNRLQIKLDTSSISKQLQEAIGNTRVQPLIINNSVNNTTVNTRQYDTIGKQIGQAVSKSLQGNFLGNALKSVFDKSIGAISVGAFEGFGRDLTKQFSKGLSTSLQAGLNESIGSTNLVGDKLGKSIVEAISSSVPEQLKKELQEDINSVLGELDITIEKNAIARKVSKQQERKTSLANEQITLTRQTDFRSYRAAKIGVDNVDARINQNLALQTRGLDISKQLTLKAENDKSKELQDAIKEVSENLDGLFAEEAELLLEREKLNKQVVKAKKQLDKSKEVFNLTAPNALPQAYAQALKDVTGKVIDPRKAPKLVVDDNSLKTRGASAAYSVESNSLFISKEMNEAIQAGKLTAQQMTTFYHEIQHALDFDFGSVKGVNASRSNVILTKPLQPTKEELAAVSPFIARYKPEERLFELNAEIAGRRKGGKAFQNQQKMQSSADFLNAFGAKGEKINTLVDNQLSTVKESILKIAEFAKNKGVDISNELTSNINDLKAVKQTVETAINKVVAVQNQELPDTEIEKVQQEIANSLDEVTKFQQKIEIFKLETLKKAKELVNIPLVNKQAEKVEISQQNKTIQAKAASKAPIASNLKIPKLTLSEFDLGYSKIKDTILPSFRNVFQEIKKDFADNKLDFVDENEIGALKRTEYLLEAIKKARQDIEQTRGDLGISKIGSPEALKINGMLGQLKQVENKVKLELTIAKNKLTPDDSGENLKARLNPLKVGKGATEEDKKRIAELNKLLESVSDNMDNVEFQFQKLDKTLFTTFENGRKNIETFFNNLFSGVQKASGAEGLIGGIFGNLDKIALGFVGFKLLENYGGKLLEFKEIAITTAKEMQSINRQVSFAAGGGSQGNNFVADIRKTAEDLRLDIKDTLTRSAGFKTATEGTSIEGALGDATYKNFQTLLAARSTGKNQANNFLVALEQSASKGLQAEELRGQMAEAVPGIISIFARSQGQSNKQFLNKMRSTTGGLDQSVLFEASQQASAESQLSLASSFDTLDSSLANLDNKMLKLQESAGNIFLPFEKFKTDVLASGIDLLVDNAGLLVKAVTVIGIHLNSGLIIQGFKFLATGFKAASLAAKAYIADVVLMNQIQYSGMSGVAIAQSVATKGYQALSASVVGIAKAAAPIALITFGLEALTGIANLIRIQFSDLSGDIGKFAENAKKANDAINNLGKTAKPGDGIDFATAETQASKIFDKKDFWGKVGATVNPFDTSLVEGNKKATDSLNATKILLEETAKLRENANSQEIFGNIENLSQIDTKLKDIRAKTEAISKLNPGDTNQLKALREEEEKLGKTRAENILNVGKSQAALEARIKELKLTKENLTEQAEAGFIFKDAYTESATAIDEELKKSESQLEKITKAIGKSKTAFDLLKKSILEINVALEDTKLKIEAESTKQKTNLADSRSLGTINQGNFTFANSLNDIGTQQKQARALQESINNQSNNFRNPEASRVLKAYNVNDSTGINKINLLAETVGSENSKFVLQEFAKLQQSKQEFSNLSLQISQSREQLTNTFREQTKQVAEYYRNIIRESQQAKLEIQKINLENSNLKIQNKLRESLTDGYDSIIGSLVDGIESALNSFNSAADKAIQGQQQLLTADFNTQDARKAGLELANQLPGNLPKIEVGLDFSSIPADNNIAQLRDDIDLSIGGSENLGTSIIGVTGNVDQLYKSFVDTLNPLNEQEKQTERTNENLAKASDLSNQWNTSLLSVSPQFDLIKLSLDSIGNAFGTLVSQTVNWIGQLTGVPDLLQKAQSFVGGIFNGNNPIASLAQNASQFVQGFSGKGGKVSWVEGSSSSMDSAPGHIGDDIFAPIGSKVHSPVSGTVVQSRVGGTKNTDDANPLVPGYQPQQLVIIKLDMPIEFEGKKISHLNMRHLLERNVEVGQKVKMGDLIGTIGEAGGKGTQFGTKNPGTAKDADAAHLHIEYSPSENNQRNSLPDAPASRLTALLSKQFKGSVASANTPGLQSVNNSGGVLWGKAAPFAPSDLSGLTARGRKAMEALKNPNVRKTLDAIAIAELGDQAAAKGGYGYLFGDVGGKETFNPNTLGSHPKRRVTSGRHTSSATGRYQTMDFVWNEEAGRLGIKDFKPQSQEIMAVSRLMYRGVLDQVMKGDIAGAINKPGNFDLSSEWASLEGNPYGQGTVGGKRSTFLANARANQVLSAANNNRFVSPGSLQSTVNQGTNTAVGTISARNEANQQNLQLQRQRDLINGETALNRVKRQNEKLIRESEDARVGRARTLTDSKFESIAFPTLQQQNEKASTDILRKKQDTLKTFKRDLEDAKRAVSDADKLIANSRESLIGEIDPNRKKVLETGISEASKTRAIKLKEVEDLNKKIKDIDKVFDAQEKARNDKATFEEYLRSSKAAIASQTDENNLLQERINKIEKIKELSPRDPRVEQLPELREQLANQQLQVETATKLLDIEEQLTKSGNDPKIAGELGKQLTLLEEQNKAKLDTIRYTKQQQDAEIARTAILRDITIKSKVADIENQFAEGKVKFVQRRNSKDAFGVDTGELDKARTEALMMQKTLAGIQLQKDIQDIQDFGRENGLASNQIEALTNNIKMLNEVKLTDLKNEFDDLLQQDRIGELSKVRENLQTQFTLVNQPRLDLANAKADRYETRGGNVFVANKMRRETGREQELFARDQSLQDLDINVAKARLSGISVSDEQVASLRNNIVELSEIKLDNLNNQFKNISTSLGDIAKTGIQGLSQGLADVITKGGSLSDVFDNLFNNVLNSALNMGINSLLGGLFGGLFYSGQMPVLAYGQIPNYASGIHPATLNKAFAKERAMSGRNPQLAVVHENELIIPAGRTEQLARQGLSPAMLLGKINNYANGNMPTSQVINRGSDNSEIKVRTEVINNREYVDREQLEYAMNEASKRGAESGARKVQMQLQNSTTYRNSIGI